MILLLLALLASTPDGLPPKAAPAPKHDAPSPAPAAAPNRETSAGKPTAVRIGDATPRKVPAPAANFTVRDSKGNVIIANGYEPGPEPPDDRQWYALGGQYAGWWGYGRALPNGSIAVDWSCRDGTTDVRRGLPALQPAPAYTLPPQAFGACASGQCPAPGYYRQPGFFGVPVSR